MQMDSRVKTTRTKKSKTKTETEKKAYEEIAEEISGLNVSVNRLIAEVDNVKDFMSQCRDFQKVIERQMQNDLEKMGMHQQITDASAIASFLAGLAYPAQPKLILDICNRLGVKVEPCQDYQGHNQ